MTNGPGIWLRNIFHRACGVLGIDIRLRRNLVRNKEVAMMDHWCARWDPLIREYRIKTLLDVGAHVGQFATMIRRHNADLQVVCFEPLRDSFAKLESVCAKIGNARCYNVALGARDGEQVMNVSSFRPSSSLLAMLDRHVSEWPASADHVQETVQIRTLDGFLQAGMVEEPLAIKIDVQGFEGNVIAGGKKMLQRAKVVVIETSFYPLYEGQPLFGDIYDSMRDLGYTYHGAVETSRSKQNGLILQEDSLYIRS